MCAGERSGNVWICGKSPLNLSFWFNGVMFSCSLDKRFFGAKSAWIGGCFFTWRLLQEVNIFFQNDSGILGGFGFHKSSIFIIGCCFVFNHARHLKVFSDDQPSSHDQLYQGNHVLWLQYSYHLVPFLWMNNCWVPDLSRWFCSEFIDWV